MPTINVLKSDVENLAGVSYTLDELEARFGRESEVRRVQMESLRWLVDLARRAGAESHQI